MDGRRSDAERWINLAYKLLINRDLVGTKSFAIRAKEADPTMGYADEILAVVDTLMAGQVQNMNGRYDWYGILGVERLCRDMDVIVGEFRRLVMLLNPQRNGLPFAEEAFGLVNEAWSVLGDPLRKSLYDNELSWLDSGSVVHQHHQIQQHQFLPMQSQPVQPQVVAPVRVQAHNVTQMRVQDQDQYQHAAVVQQQAPYQPQFQQRPQKQVQFELSQPRVQVAQPVVQPQERVQPQVVSQPQPLWAQPQPVIQPQPVWAQPQQVSQSQAQRVAQPSVYSQPVTQPQAQSQGHTRLQPQQPPMVQGYTHPQQQQPQPRQQEPIRMQADPHPQLWKSPVRNLEEEHVEVEEVETEHVEEDEAEVLTFWTACPFCYHLFEYLKEYEDCTLRCQNKNCRRAFHGSPIAPPPESKSDKKVSFCSWGFFPVGASPLYLNSGKHESAKHSWLPFSPMFTCPTEPSKGVTPVAPNNWSRARPKPKAVILDDDDYVMMELSDSSDSSDTDFKSRGKSTERKKRGRPPKTKTITPVRKSARRSAVEKSRSGASETGDHVVGNNGNTTDVFANEGAGDVSAAKVATAKSALNGNVSKKASGKNPKDLGKLDLNLEFNNEVDETISSKTNTNGPATSVSAGTSTGAGTTSEVEENIETEGIGFFEGLDEFLNNLPILSAVSDDKVKAA